MSTPDDAAERSRDRADEELRSEFALAIDEEHTDLTEALGLAMIVRDMIVSLPTVDIHELRARCLVYETEKFLRSI